MLDRLSWERDADDWPNREASRFVEAGGVRWHLQRSGHGDPLLLIHGTGSSAHSWRDLVPLLAGDHEVIALDLPGHGFSSMPAADALSLAGMARAVSALIGVLGVRPVLIAGHSAGAAIAARVVLDGGATPAAICGVNGAFTPLRGLPGLVFPPVARLFAGSDRIAKLSAWRGRDRNAVERLVRQTGSQLDPRGVDLYARLLRSPGHIAGALGMMANWDLVSLEVDLPRLTTPLHLLVGGADRTVPPRQSERIRDRVAVSTLTSLPGLGHLAHEEAPARVAAWIRAALQPMPACAS